MLLIATSVSHSVFDLHSRMRLEDCEINEKSTCGEWLKCYQPQSRRFRSLSWFCQPITAPGSLSLAHTIYENIAGLTWLTA